MLVRPLPVTAGGIVGYLTGACLAIRREAWDSLGPFDEEFFLMARRPTGKGAPCCSGLARCVWRTRSAFATLGTGQWRETPPFRRGRGICSGPASHSNWSTVRSFLQSAIWRGASLVESVETTASSIAARTRPATPSSSAAGWVPRSVRDRISVASELARAGYAVTVVSLGRLGTLPRVVPASIRLLRRPWWWPSTGPDRTPRVLVMGTTKKERAFARLFRLRRNRVCVQPSAALSSLTHMTQGHETAPAEKQKGLMRISGSPRGFDR